MPTRIKTHYYQHFDADFEREVPAEGYGGWKTAELEFDLDHTALVVMHTWDCGTREQFPGWHRCVEYIPRSYRICEEVFPPLLTAARGVGLRIFHVVIGKTYYQDLPGYRQTLELEAADPGGGQADPPVPFRIDRTFEELTRFRQSHVFPGDHNRADIERGQVWKRFPRQAEPADGEPIADTSRQLQLLCREYGINHLVYTGFAIDGCLLLSPGGMVDMSRLGILCSTIRQAVTAIENRETARGEQAKELALWRVALLYGFVFDVDDFITGIRSGKSTLGS